VEEHGPCCVLAACGPAVDPHAAQVVVRVPAGRCLVPQDTVRQARVPQVLPAHVMEGLGSVGRAHAVHLDHDEAQVRQVGEGPRGPEGLGYVRVVRTRVDGLDHRDLLVRIQAGRPAKDAPDVRLAVPGLGHKDLRGLPATGLQLRDVGLLQFTYEPAVRCPAELVYRGPVHAGVGVDEEPAVRGVADGVGAVSLGQGDQARAVEVDPVAVDQVRVLTGDAATGPEPDLARGLVHPVHAPDHPLAAGDRVPDAPPLHIDQVEVLPPVPLRGEEDLLVARSIVDEGLVGRVDEGLGLLVVHRACLAGV